MTMTAALAPAGDPPVARFPHLDAMRLPSFADLTPETILSSLDAGIAFQNATIERLVAERPTTFEEIWLPLERADVALDALWSAVSHLRAVADEPALREAFQEGQRRYVDQAMQVGQNVALFEILEGLTVSPAFADLPLADRAAVEKAVLDRRFAGVALPIDQRERFREVSLELSSLATDFGNAVLDATDAWIEHVEDEGLLAGLSPADKEMFAAAAKARDIGGWAVTLQQPSVSAVLTFAENRGLRERVYHASATRASDQGPNAGRYDNSARMDRILALRREAAGLLGFADPVARSVARKMAGSGEEILVFLRDLARSAKPAAVRELADLRAFAAAELGLAELQPWDIAFAANRQRMALHAIDEQEIRSHFPVERVLAGWADLLHRLYGLALRQREVDLWHEDARYFDIFDEAGAVIAGLYVDLHARPGKRGGAWMAPARPRLRDAHAARVPVAYLTCNFPSAGGDVPALLSHYDVQTLLHETGHCLHHLLTEIDRPSVGGISGFEWDAVELPSQLMEDFAWDQEVLRGMSGHYLTGEPLPAELFSRLAAARHFQSGMFVVRQLEFSLFDMLLHSGSEPRDPIALIGAVREEVAVVHPPAWHRFPHAFGHIYSGGYAAGYYSYLWAEVLAADAFMRFAEAGLVDRATGNLFRREVLARGSTRPAAESFRAFRGRDPDPAALLARHGLAPPAQACG